MANVVSDKDGPMALVTINRPDKHNAISLQTLSELHSAIDDAASDERIRVITITGAGGKAFAAGSDLSEVIDRDLAKALEPIVQGLADKLERIPKPTIAAIDGICMLLQKAGLLHLRENSASFREVGLLRGFLGLLVEPGGWRCCSWARQLMGEKR